MAIGRPTEFPDPNDRSPSNPHVLIERDALINLYNQANPDKPAKNVSESVRDWFDKEAKARGWSNVMFPTQNTAVLEANVVLQST